MCSIFRTLYNAETTAVDNQNKAQAAYDAMKTLVATQTRTATELQTAKNNDDNAKAAVTTAKTRVTAATSALDLATKWKTASESLATLQAQLATANSNVSTHQASVNSLTTQIATFTASQASAQAEVNTATTTNNEAEAKLKTATDNVASITTKLNAAITAAKSHAAPSSLNINMMARTALAWNADYANTNSAVYKSFVSTEEPKLLTRVKALLNGQTLAENPTITKLYAGSSIPVTNRRRRSTDRAVLC